MLLSYGAPALPLAVLTLPVYIFLPAFYTQEIGIPIATVGTVLLLTRAFDAVSDPLIGYASDRLSTRFGRRKVWLIAGAPLAALAAYMLFVPFAGASASYLLFWSLVLSLAWTGIIVPYGAWGAELTGDYDERSRIAGVREGLTIVSGPSPPHFLPLDPVRIFGVDFFVEDFGNGRFIR